MGPNLRISGAQTFPYAETDIRVNFNDLSKIIAAANLHVSGNTGQGQFFSLDGGGSWGQGNLPLAPGDKFTSDPGVDWSYDGMTAWATTVGFTTDSQGNPTNFQLRFYTSTDFGQSWTLDVTAGVPSGTQTNVDKPMIWVDHSSSSNFKDNIYIIWYNNGPVFMNVRKGPSGAWPAPTQISGIETKGTGIGGDIKTNSRGDVFAFWPDTGSKNLFVAKSTNGGNNFSAPVKITQTFDSYDIDIPSIHNRHAMIYISGGTYWTSTKDLVYAVWTDLTGDPTCIGKSNEPGTNVSSSCKTRIWFSRSTTGGTNWEPARMINNQPSLNDQFAPRLAVDDNNGQLVVIYYDTVNDPGRLKTDVWVQVSNDDGATWSSPTQVTSAPTDETASSADPTFQYGDYNGLSGYRGMFFPSWTDRRSGGKEEIWTAPILTNTGCFITTDRSTFGLDEINTMLNAQNPPVSAPVVIDAAFYIIVDGFRPADLGITAADLSGTPNTSPTIGIAPNPTQMSVNCTALKAVDPSLPPYPQRFTWVYQIQFTGTSDFPQVPGAVNQLTLTATAANVSGSAIIQLIDEPNPFEIDGPVSWLSQDLRVFQIIPGAALRTQGSPPLPPLTLTGSTAGDCSAFIQGLIAAFNAFLPTGAPGTLPGYIHPFELISTDEQLSSLSLSSHDNNNNPVFNFALARVRCQTSVPIDNVRVFFRLFPALSTSTAYDQATTYARMTNPDKNQPIPILGVSNQSGQIITIPFFAEPRVDPSVDMTHQKDLANLQTIQANTSDTYFGCWLDINQPNDFRFPLQPSPVIGPFSTGLLSIQQLIVNQHQCLAAEIAFDPDPIPPGVSPAMSDKLAQRNLSIVGSANPGNVASRRIPNTFDIQPTRMTLQSSEVPDELMIDWGDIPIGSQATFYLPDNSVAEMLQMASKLYITHRLERVDDHTLRCRTGGITYIPVPPGIDNYVGLLTVDLPAGVRKGQIFKPIVHQITPLPQRRLLRGHGPKAPHTTESRRIIGSFQITIPVRTMEVLLGPEERLLSVLRWIEESIPPASRWFLVFRRYVNQIADRVSAFGGDPDIVGPSPSGEWHSHHHKESGHAREERMEYSGKVEGLVYGRFGDFEGFLLDTEDGERRFVSHERKVEKLVHRAWAERIVTTVIVERDEPNRPMSIILHGMPPLEE